MKKLTDNQLDEVSGGKNRYTPVSDEAAAYLDKNLCPDCHIELVPYSEGGVIHYVQCLTCKKIYTRYYNRWDQMTKPKDIC